MRVHPRLHRGAVEFAALLQRRWARLAVNGQIQVAIRDLDLALELRDLSFGGFAVHAPRPFWKGMTHWFTFSTPAGQSITLVAKAVHCYRLPDQPRFVSGWVFMAGTADRTERAIGQLLDALY